ncbi:MAG: hypothetical protein JO260_04490, partial [Acidobacteria bacterium]|nr:hypothetical protein [Acidobacteriota bacterium]
GILDHGAYYAQKTQVDGKGNRILWGWITEKRPDSELLTAGWAGCMSLPRVLKIGDGNTLEMEIAPESRSLRQQTFEIPNKLPPQERTARVQQIEIKNISGEFFWMSNAMRSNFSLADQTGERLTVVAEQDENGSRLKVNGKTIDIPLASRPLRDFSLFLDASVAELICDNRHAITIRIYRKPAGPLKITCDTSEKNLYQLSAWQLQPISPNRLTT